MPTDNAWLAEIEARAPTWIGSELETGPSHKYVTLTPGERDRLCAALRAAEQRIAVLETGLDEHCWAMYGHSTAEWLECTACGHTAPFSSTKREHRPDCEVAVLLAPAGER